MKTIKTSGQLKMLLLLPVILTGFWALFDVILFVFFGTFAGLCGLAAVVSFKVMQVLCIIYTKSLCIMYRPLYVVQCVVFFVNPPCSWVLNENVLERLL